MCNRLGTDLLVWGSSSMPAYRALHAGSGGGASGASAGQRLTSWPASTSVATSGSPTRVPESLFSLTLRIVPLPRWGLGVRTSYVR